MELGALAPWRSWELWRPWRCRSSGGHGRWTSGPWPRVPSARPLQPELILPPKKFPWGSEGVSEPSGAKQTGQYKTRQERPPGPDRQDRTAHRNRKPSWAGLEAEASSGHDKESGALTGSLSNRFHFGPRRVSVDMTDKIVKMFLWARHDIHRHSWHTCG